MKKNSDSSFIKDYEKIRHILRHMLLYGDYTSLDYAENDYATSRMASEYIKKIKSYLSEDALSIHKNPDKSKDKKTYRIVYDPIKVPMNFLCETYNRSTFLREDLVFFYLLMQLTKDYYEDEYYSQVSEEYEDADNAICDYEDYEEELIAADKTCSLKGSENKNLEKPELDCFSCRSCTQDCEHYSSRELVNENNRIHHCKELLYQDAFERKSIQAWLPFIENLHRNILHEIGQRSDRISYNNIISSPFVLSRDEILNRINTMLDLGYIEQELQPHFDKANNKTGYKSKTSESTVYLRLTKDIFNLYDKGFDDSYLDRLQLFVDFSYNHRCISIPGYQLANSLDTYRRPHPERYCKDSESPDSADNDSIFFYKGSAIHNVLDDDVKWAVAQAIANHNAIEYTYKNKTLRIYPLKILVDCQYGRNYIWGYSKVDNTTYNIRIDQISDVSELSEKLSIDYAPDYTKASAPDEITEKNNQYYEEHHKYCWNINTGTSTENILIHFRFTDENSCRITRRAVQTSGRHGTITDIDTLSFDFSVEVYDPGEMLPWIRRFGECATVDRKNCPDFYKLIKSDYEEILKYYEAI